MSAYSRAGGDLSGASLGDRWYIRDFREPLVEARIAAASMYSDICGAGGDYFSE